MREGIRKRRPRTLVSLLAIIASILSFVVIGGITARVAHAQNPGFTEYSLTSGYDRPLAIVTGADKNLWFTELTGANIGTITPSGTVTEYAIPNYSGFLGTGGIAAGPDGNVWFTDLSNNTVGKITTSGTITEYAALQTANSYPESMTVGPDGNLWFTEGGANFVGKVTTAGTISEYAISGNASSTQIAAGPDGNVWFAEQALDKIAQVTPSGTVTEFQLATGAQPAGIVAGPDGNLWVSEQGTGVIDKVSTSGTVLAQYPVLTSGASLQDMSIGPDGKIWFTEYGGNALGSITTAGVITEYATGESGNPFGIASGPDGNLWYTEYNGDAVGRFALNACASLADSASQSPIGTGAPETIAVTLISCGLAQLNATTSTTVTAPSGCPAAPAIPSFTSSLSLGQTDSHTTAFATPSCPGIYTVNSQTTVGSTVMATAQTTYNVLATGGGVLYSTYPRPQYIAPGSDGNLWYTDGSTNVNQITPSGTITPYPVLPSAGALITTGPDGNLYVTNGASGVAQVTLGGCCGPQFGWQVPAGGTGNSINDIEPGIDGNVWFTATGPGNTGTVGLVTPGAKFKKFKLPVGSGAPQAIAAGSDNAMWFTLSSNQVGRITAAGAVTMFALPSNVGVGGGEGTATLGPDGNIWLTGADVTTRQSYVVSISPAGAVHVYSTLTAQPETGGIATGADGNLWVNEIELGPTPECSSGFGGGVARVTPAGGMTDFGAGCNDTNPKFNIVAGPDGNMWNAAYYGIGINLIETGVSSACTAIAASNNPNTVAEGSTETISVKVSNCSTTPRLMKVATKTVPPSGCGTATTTHANVPLQPRVGTTVSSSFNAPTCAGTYKVTSTLSVGKTVLAKATTTYHVT